MIFKIRIICALFLAIPLSTYGEVGLPRLISDGLVLQRNADVKIWGWAHPGENVTITFLDQKHTILTSESGNWEIQLSNLSAGGPYKMEIAGENSITINNILVGDVWLCSGQSNMETSMQRVSPLYETEIAAAGNPNIRYFEVPKTYDFNEEHKDLSGGKWEPVSQENILSLSAVAYFYALELYNKYGVPIGLINSSLGGAAAESWISEDALKAFPVQYNEAVRFKDRSLIHQIETKDQVRIQNWYQKARELDEGYSDSGQPWHLAELNTSGWPTMDIPGYWPKTKLGDINGVVWFRKTINIPFSLVGKEAKLLLGTIVDADSTYVNGVFVGTTSYQYPPRRYTIPDHVLKEGENSIVVRVINSAGRGGFVPDKPYKVMIGDTIIDLKGKWRYRLGAKMEYLASQTFVSWKPLGLYNAMISPLLNFRIKGVIWYQGETNTQKPYDYSESKWALIREAQLYALSLPNTGMAVTIDLGEWNDVHPLNKKDVSKRLAKAAYKVAYGENKIVFSGPIFKSVKFRNDKVKISFSNVGGGLITRDGKEPMHFALSGKDKQFAWAEASIKNRKVIVRCDKVQKPVSVRYAWADNPENANLYNKEGLPASPFRTDKWNH
jgi:sialate O-acetylesterase